MANPGVHSNSRAAHPATLARVLRAIARGGYDTFREVADGIGIGIGAVCNAARQLEQEGLIVLQPGAGKARRPLITDAGRERIRALRETR